MAQALEPDTQPSAPTAAGRSILAVAGPAMREILAQDGGERDRAQVLKQNLSRYFAAYPINLSGLDGQRLVGTVERMSRRFAEELYREAEAGTKARGAALVEVSDAAAAISRRLPSEPTRYRSVTFFPTAGTATGAVHQGSSLEVENADLEAFAATGLAWNSLGYLVTKPLAEDPAALALAPEAVEQLASAVSAYGLLVLRLAGRHAASERAIYVQSRHLRLAGKTIEERATGKPAPILVPPHIEVPKGGAPPFTDVTAAAGVDFRHVTSDWLSRFRRFGPPAPSFSGGGATAGDVDGDGWPDLIICGGEGCALFHNRGDGTFENHTEASGIGVDGEARMAVLADFDNDGRSDLFVTYARDPNRLFRNVGKAESGSREARFEDVTAASGLDRAGDISGPAVAFDYDSDGLLDLYIGNFGNYLAGETPWETTDARNGMPNRLYRNLGGLRFADVTVQAGVGNTGWSQALSHADLDLDGDQDLYLANDFGRNELLLNRGDGTFEAAGAATATDDPFHGMNVSFADLNGDQRPEIFITNIWHWQPARREVGEYNTLLTSLPAGPDGRPRFARGPAPGQLAVDTGWSWAGLFFDADLDGDEDLFVVNGLTDYSTFVQFRPHPQLEGQIYPINDGGEPNLFFRNENGLPDHLAPSGAELAGLNSRGLALADYDQDGDLDLLITTFHGRAHLFRNDAPAAGNHWLAVELVGDPEMGVNRDAIGAQLIALNTSNQTTSEGARRFSAWRAVTGGEGYLSMSSLPVELGLGPHTAVDLEVIWPNGTKQSVQDVPADRRIRIRLGVDGWEEIPSSRAPDMAKPQ